VKNIGNKFNPVTNIGWREAVVWCNAYSEMDGLDPVYRDSEGNVLRDSRVDVDKLVDAGLIEVSFDTTKKKGYRLPTAEEWFYAAKGANVSADEWDYNYPGTNSDDQAGDYLWSHSPKLANSGGGMLQTTEVGSLQPNSAGLYDMQGMVNQWVWWTSFANKNQQLNGYTWGVGEDFYSFNTSDFWGLYGEPRNSTEPNAGYSVTNSLDPVFFGFRIARNKE